MEIIHFRSYKPLFRSGSTLIQNLAMQNVELQMVGTRAELFHPNLHVHHSCGQLLCHADGDLQQVGSQAELYPPSLHVHHFPYKDAPRTQVC